MAQGKDIYYDIKYYIDNFCKVLNISDYIGIIAYGSYVKKTNTTLSDLDIMIIKSNYNTQDCGSLNIDGVFHSRHKKNL